MARQHPVRASHQRCGAAHARRPRDLDDRSPRRSGTIARQCRHGAAHGFLVDRRRLESRVLKPRRAFTLVELCMALTLGALTLSIVVAIGTRERRLHVALAHRVAGARQLRHAAQILPIDLRALDPRGGDISPGEARDTSIQFRSTVAAGVICSISATEIALVPAAAREGELYSELSAPRAGDTLWSLGDADTSDLWIPAAIQSVRQSVGRCGA